MQSPSQIFKEQSALRSKSELVQRKQSNENNFAIIQYNIQSEIRLKNKHSIKDQIEFLQSEITALDQITDQLSEEQRKYRKSRLKLKLMQVLRQSEHVSTLSINHIGQKIEKENKELMLYVLKEALARDQNRELFMTDGIHSCGFDSIIGAFGQDQECLRFRTTQVEYEQLKSDCMLREEYLLNFQEKVSKIFKVSPSDVQILDITEGSSIISFKIQSKADLINEPESMEFLEKTCNGKVDIYNYFFESKHNKSRQIGLSSKDFDSRYNMVWDGLRECQQRGPLNQRYDYYFPKGCYGFGLDITKYGIDQNWIQMDGNKDEWRILFHGTKNENVNDIIVSSLKEGWRSLYEDDLCKDEFGNNVPVGKGIYFSDKFTVCVDKGYAKPIQVNNKSFSAIFMTRVNPKKIRQSDRMKQERYFLVNRSADVRQYRVLIYENK
ncbi:unnamed protein product (macronuclear) [Paramecium tetraurelia]|uniref:PARP catalytic domain-containing protein n=1 Tax=Paramecium tetraurelia TaxID=5888 RepID=A0DU18_PARTE|nr:uncharacterized protein GSPATT00020219001 [Paramecium tetraurelia]CAK86535.1 unnamed protein product [Paramecium tetraurelia]|eukprot:XP_001453932.1 hypothetical protein (macronuclear) [Paramecium tetraurelia strain d4-2]